MHPALHLKNISKLPSDLQRIATAAANGSFVSLERLSYYLSRKDYQPSTLVLFLPAFYANLDPAGIPAYEVDPDALLLDENNPPSRALEVLRSMHLFSQASALPVEVSADFWPPVWQWIQFIAAQRELLPGVREKPEYIVFGLFESLIQLFQLHPGTAKIISSTPGVRTVLTRAWVLILDIKDIADREEYYMEISTFLRDTLKIGEPANLAEVLEGVGGTLQDLGSAIVKHLDVVTVGRTSRLTKPPLAFLASMIMFCEGAHKMPKASGSRFWHAVREKGGARAFTAAILALQDVPSTAINFMDAYANMLLFQVGSATGYEYIIQALDAGLLRALVNYFTKGMGNDDHDWRQLLVRLRPYLVYYPVLSHFKTAFLEFDEERVARDLRRCPIWTAWDNFSSEAHRHLELKADFDAEHDSVKACDNLECGDIYGKAEVSRCSGCQSMYYCSTECQIKDWKAGHRSFCRHHRFVNFNDPAPFNTRAKSFLRALVDNVHEQYKEQIWLYRMQFMRKRPGVAFYTLFDYSTTSFRSTVFAVDDVQHSNVHEEARWRDFVSRAARSGGRMFLDVVRVFHSPEKHIDVVLPMRCDKPTLCEAVGRLAADRKFGLGSQRDVGPRLEKVLDKIRDYLEQEVDDVLVIH